MCDSFSRKLYDVVGYAQADVTKTKKQKKSSKQQGYIYKHKSVHVSNELKLIIYFHFLLQDRFWTKSKIYVWTLLITHRNENKKKVNLTNKLVKKKFSLGISFIFYIFSTACSSKLEYFDNKFCNILKQFTFYMIFSLIYAKSLIQNYEKTTMIFISGLYTFFFHVIPAFFTFCAATSLCSV
jgi:hypothetical protein